jgi:hypothetical protein
VTRETPFVRWLRTSRTLWIYTGVFELFWAVNFAIQSRGDHSQLWYAFQIFGLIVWGWSAIYYYRLWRRRRDADAAG